MNPDYFDPQTEKRYPSASKKIATVVMCAMSVLFLVVIFAIMNKSEITRSAEPKKLFEAPENPAGSLESQAARLISPELDLEEDEEIFDEEVVLESYTKKPQIIIPEQRRSDHTLRIMAANSTTMPAAFNTAEIIGKFESKNNNPRGYSYTEEDLQREIAAASARETASMAMFQQQEQVDRQTDPNGWNAKEKFINDTNKLPEGYAQHFRTQPKSKLELKAGSVVPCVLISGINSDLPGNTIGQVAEDVYDSATGKNLLIPKGSRVVGTYDQRVTYGQSRVLVVWSKIVYPDGSTLMLDNLKGVDQSGYTGAKGSVNRHWNSIVGAALVVSLMGAGVDIATPSNRRDDDSGSILAENATRSVAEAMSKIIEREADRAPTIKIKPGIRFMLFVQQDMLFTQKWK